MTIKKFKNGNIRFKLELSDKFYYGDSNQLYDEAIKNDFSVVNIDKIYYDEFSNNDLSLESINGYGYLLDSSTEKLYPIYTNGYQLASGYALQGLKDLLVNRKDNDIKLFPLDNKTTKSLLQDLQNGY